jgi:hypothetical protein
MHSSPIDRTEHLSEFKRIEPSLDQLISVSVFVSEQNVPHPYGISWSNVFGFLEQVVVIVAVAAA